MKTARRSFSKTPYICQKPWAEDVFCQCGGDGVVFTEPKDLEKTLTDPQEQTEALKAVLGVPSAKKHYRTAFFEAFPNDPSCFIRGQGSSIEEAENKAWEKWQKILACTHHQWDRKGRTDGYAFCLLCPLSGSFLEPLTKCHVCNIPTYRHSDKNGTHFCVHHYFNLTPEEVVEDKEQTLGFSKEENIFHFIEDKTLFFKIVQHHPNLNDNQWQKIWDHFIHLRAEISSQYEPFFGVPTKSKQEIHEIVLQLMPEIVNNLLKNCKL